MQQPTYVFSRSQLVLRGGFRFYFGFPLFTPDGATAIGAVCCVDREPRRVCQSQCETLGKLSRSATRIIASRLTTNDDDCRLLFSGTTSIIII
ncbi:hypothetical protein PC129_g20625 [Phytophthora cactorum]|uniref:GAF domain-containing protein n=1 Tax=Phytophthora cactorum TaxID=29920 RepID=A0A8T1EXD6_9STRA|nr:hypothetical protein PC111_g12188 [Phytophthora cactorum]KAG2830330.1 hypothetical protein PC112_g7724 [Phytophthora cactorum]KAG2832120.1 hypothetical protein PC113_g20810 [Phytophthora cactorum]KAG2877998.1 hypothetical protein PC114_g23347 [Phytophthora cactorum]KAG2890523.1 hypothetical protein PC115_g19474 [Phytophthora cactorum]